MPGAAVPGAAVPVSGGTKYGIDCKSIPSQSDDEKILENCKFVFIFVQIMPCFF